MLWVYLSCFASDLIKFRGCVSPMNTGKPAAYCLLVDSCGFSTFRNYFSVFTLFKYSPGVMPSVFLKTREK